MWYFINLLYEKVIIYTILHVNRQWVSKPHPDENDLRLRNRSHFIGGGLTVGAVFVVIEIYLTFLDSICHFKKMKIIMVLISSLGACFENKDQDILYCFFLSFIKQFLSYKEKIDFFNWESFKYYVRLGEGYQKASRQKKMSESRSKT